MKVMSAFVVANPEKEWAVKLKREVEAFLIQRGVRVEEGQVLITIGGDGTLLYNKNKYNKPVFGIGNERSFICQSNYKNWREILERLLKRNKIERRSMLECRSAGKRYENALNEVCIRSRDHRLVELILFFNGKKATFRADGVLFSTPTGSTAYAYSCGAPELPPNAKKYEVVPIAPYRRSFKPVVLPNSAKCTVVVKKGNADLVIDGQFIHHIKTNSKIAVEVSRKHFSLLKPA
ncbi:MAG: NAD(+)/NADH kinase [Candidatus Micrarchaeia archaeon]